MPPSWWTRTSSDRTIWCAESGPKPRVTTAEPLAVMRVGRNGPLPMSNGPGAAGAAAPAIRRTSKSVCSRISSFEGFSWRRNPVPESFQSAVSASRRLLPSAARLSRSRTASSVRITRLCDRSFSTTPFERWTNVRTPGRRSFPFNPSFRKSARASSPVTSMCTGPARPSRSAWRASASSRENVEGSLKSRTWTFQHATACSPVTGSSTPRIFSASNSHGTNVGNSIGLPVTGSTHVLGTAGPRMLTRPVGSNVAAAMSSFDGI